MADFLSHNDIRLDDAGATVAAAQRHANANGGVHGGLIMTLIDSTMGQAVRAGLQDGQSTVTVQLSTTFLRGAESGDELRCTAQVRKRGGALVMVEADVVRADDDEAIAHGVATFSVIDDK